MRRLSSTRLILLAAGMLLFAFSHAQTVIQVSRGDGTACVPTLSGVISSKYCADGDDGVGESPLVWAPIPGFTNKIVGESFSVDLVAQYLTQPGSPDATITVDCTTSLPTGGWSFSSPDLSYSDTGTTTGTVTCIASAFRDPETALSNSFQIESVAAQSPGTDTTAPPAPTGVTAVLNSSDEPVISFDPGSDPRVADQDVSGLASFDILRDGVEIAADQSLTGTDFSPTFTTTDVGTVTDSDATQDGADWTQQGQGGHPIDGTDFVFTHAPVTGDFIATVKVASSSGGTAGGRGANLLMREGTAATSRQFNVHLYPSFNNRCYVRSVTSGDVVQTGLVTLDAFTGWLRIKRAGNTLTASASNDGNDFGEVCSQTLGLSATLQVGIGTQANEAVTTTVEYEGLAINTLPRQTYTDTTAVAGNTYSYTVRWNDTAGNTSAQSTAVSIAVPSGGGGGASSQTADYNDHAVPQLGGGRAVAAANSTAFNNALADLECGDVVTVADDFTITGSRNWNVTCASNNRPIIVCETYLGCAATGTWTANGAGSVVSGFTWSGTGSGFDCNGDRHSLVGFTVTNWGTATGNSRWWHATDGGEDRCEVAYGTINAGTAVTSSSAFRWWARPQTSSAQGSVPTRGWMHHLLFKSTHTSGSDDDRSDLIELGETGSQSWVETADFEWYIEDLVFDDVQIGGHAIVDVKLGGTVIRRIRYVNGSTGRTQIRFGSGSIIESVYAPGQFIAGGGADHKYVCNEATVWVLAGDLAYNDFSSNGHKASRSALVADNIGTLVNGHQYDTETYTFPANLTTIESHTGGVSTGNATNTTDNRNSSSSYTCPPADDAAPIASEVGADAIVDASETYIDNRGLPWTGSSVPDECSTSGTDTACYDDPVDGITATATNDVAVTDLAELVAAVNGASCGDRIQLANGTYTLSSLLDIDTVCPATSPVVVEAANALMATITGNTVLLDGAYNIITGINFTLDGTQVRLAGTNNKIIGNDFSGFDRAIRVEKPGQYGEIAYNDFHDHDAWDADTGSNQQSRIAIRTLDDGTEDVMQDVWVHGNHFKDFDEKPDPDRYSSGQNDAIELCETQGANYSEGFASRWYIERNLLTDHEQGHGTIDLKCPGGSVVWYNAYVSSPGRIDVRGRTSLGATVESNHFDGGSGGIDIHGCNNRVIGNSGGTLGLVTGNYECDGPYQSGHARADGTLVAGHTGSLIVGRYNFGINAIRTTIEEISCGSVSLQNHSNTTNNCSSSTDITFTAAATITAANAGVSALSGAPTAWLTARALN